MFCTFTLVRSDTCAVHSIAVFCSALISCFPGTLLRYFLNYFDIVLLTPVITVFTFLTRFVFILNSFYFTFSSVSFFITFLSPEIVTSISMHVAFSLSWIITSGLLLRMVLSVCTVDSFMWLLRLLHLFLLISAPADTGVFRLILATFPRTCWSLFEHKLHHVDLCVVLLPELRNQVLLVYFLVFLLFFLLTVKADWIQSQSQRTVTSILMSILSSTEAHVSQGRDISSFSAARPNTVPISHVLRATCLYST